MGGQPEGKKDESGGQWKLEELSLGLEMMRNLLD